MEEDPSIEKCAEKPRRKISCCCWISIVFIVFIFCVGLVAYFTSSHFAAYLCRTRSPYERIHFEDNEFDYWVKVNPADVNETLDNVNWYGARLLDYQLAQPGVLFSKLEKALAGNVTLVHHGPTPVTEHLLGTHHLWTGVYFTRKRNNPSEYELHYMQDDARRKILDFPDKQYKGFCKGKGYYDNLFKNPNITSPLRVVVQVTCEHDDYNPPVMTTKCTKSCLTIVPDDPVSKKMYIYRTPKCDAEVGPAIVGVPISSQGRRESVAFHYGKLTKAGLDAALQSRKVRRLSPSIVDRYNYEISSAFSKVEYVMGGSTSEMLFWMEDFSIREINNFKYWCPRVSPIMINSAKARNPNANFFLRISNFANASGNRPCVTIRDGSQASFYVAYQHELAS